MGDAFAQPVRYRKFADQKDGVPRGFNTPTRKIELYSEIMLEHGYPPLPEFEEPLMSPFSRPDLAERFPLILTSAKNTLFCETQHRGLPSLQAQSSNRPAVSDTADKAVCVTRARSMRPRRRVVVHRSGIASSVALAGQPAAAAVVSRIVVNQALPDSLPHPFKKAFHKRRAAAAAAPARP